MNGRIGLCIIPTRASRTVSRFRENAINLVSACTMFIRWYTTALHWKFCLIFLILKKSFQLMQLIKFERSRMRLICNRYRQYFRQNSFYNNFLWHNLQFTIYFLKWLSNEFNVRECNWQFDRTIIIWSKTRRNSSAVSTINFNIHFISNPMTLKYL